MGNEKLHTKTEYLFSRDWEEDLPNEEAEAVEDRADNFIAEYGWPTVFEAWNSYLHTNAGYPEADLYLHPYYAVDQDPKILAEVDNWRKTLA